MNDELLIASTERIVSIPLDKICYTDVFYNKELDKFDIAVCLLNSEVLKFQTSYGQEGSKSPAVTCLELAKSKHILL